MQKIIQNPGLQHLAQRMLIYLDKTSIASFRFVNQDCKNIVDDPIFSLKKLSQLVDVPKDLIENWKKIIPKLLGNDSVKREITLDLFKMYCTSDAKYPLDLVYKLAKAKSEPDLLTAIFENANPKSYMIPPKPLYGNLRPIHLAAEFGYLQVARNLIKISRFVRNQKNKLQKIIENPGLQHLAQRMLFYLDKTSIASFRLVNQDCKNIVDDPIFSLKKLSQLVDVPKDLIENWKKIIPKLLGNDSVQQEITLDLFKMYCTSDAKYPLDLVYKLAEAKSKPDLVAAILESANPQSYMIAPKPLYGNLRPIHLAAGFGYVQVARNLIKRNSYLINYQEEHGITPIYLASQNDHLEMLQFLLSSSGNPNIQDTQLGKTPILGAIDRGNMEIVRLLISKTDTPNAPDNEGWTPIWRAAYDGHADIVKLLMSTTDAPNAPANNGHTPIHAAALKGHIDIVQLLISTTDTPNASANTGWTPIHFAASKGHIDIVQLLISTTDTPNAPTNDGRTPIHLAAAGGYANIVQLLMSTTDTPNAPDNNGWTPIMFAQQNDHKEVVLAFLQHYAKTPMYNV